MLDFIFNFLCRGTSLCPDYTVCNFQEVNFFLCRFTSLYLENVEEVGGVILFDFYFSYTLTLYFPSSWWRHSKYLKAFNIYQNIYCNNSDLLPENYKWRNNHACEKIDQILFLLKTANDIIRIKKILDLCVENLYLTRFTSSENYIWRYHDNGKYLCKSV